MNLNLIMVAKSAEAEGGTVQLRSEESPSEADVAAAEGRLDRKLTAPECGPYCLTMTTIWAEDRRVTLEKQDQLCKCLFCVIGTQ